MAEEYSLVLLRDLNTTVTFKHAVLTGVLPLVSSQAEQICLITKFNGECAIVTSSDLEFLEGYEEVLVGFGIKCEIKKIK